MKIGFFADGPWSHLSLDKISKVRNVEILFIVPRYENQDPVLKKWAKKLSIDFIIEKNINSKNSIKKLKKYKADLFVSMSYNQIIKKELFKLPPKGFINCHAGALPFYRGRSVLNWVLINGEKSYGVTVHYINQGIDTGDIILQKKYLIRNNDDYSTLLSKAAFNCAVLLDKALKLIMKDKAKRVKQISIDKNGSYYKQRKEGDEIIQWNQDTARLLNFIRALVYPGPIAQTSYGNNCIKIKSAVKVAYKTDIVYEPGTIVALHNRRPIVKTSDGFLKIINFSSNNRKNYNIKIGIKFN